MGGAIFHFSQKIGLKSTKNMRFCILHKPMGGALAPPAPPLATLLIVAELFVFETHRYVFRLKCEIECSAYHITGLTV